MAKVRYGDRLKPVVDGIQVPDVDGNDKHASEGSWEAGTEQWCPERARRREERQRLRAWLFWPAMMIGR
nr:hypothetical protein CFP56_11547 [Quercus suber]